MINNKNKIKQKKQKLLEVPMVLSLSIQRLSCTVLSPWIPFLTQHPHSGEVKTSGKKIEGIKDFPTMSLSNSRYPFSI